MIPDLTAWKATAQKGIWAYKGVKSVFVLFTAFRRLGKRGRTQHAISPKRYKRMEQNRNQKKHFSGWTVWACFWFCKFAWTVKKRYF